MKASYTLLVTGLATRQVTATWNLFGNPFKSPNYNNNECNEKQKSGFDWSELKEGISNFEYSDFDFSGGWKCANSFNKRDHITKRTFGSKCIKNKVRKDKAASFGCSKRKSGFSIEYIDVSVEYDVSLDLYFTMGDGSVCRMLDIGCKADGSSIKNTQYVSAKLSRRLNLLIDSDVVVQRPWTSTLVITSVATKRSARLAFTILDSTATRIRLTQNPHLRCPLRQYQSSPNQYLLRHPLKQQHFARMRIATLSHR